MSEHSLNEKGCSVIVDPVSGKRITGGLVQHRNNIVNGTFEWQGIRLASNKNMAAKNWMYNAVCDGDVELMGALLDHLNIPGKDLTLKQRLAIYELGVD